MDPSNATTNTCIRVKLNQIRKDIEFMTDYVSTQQTFSLSNDNSISSVTAQSTNTGTEKNDHNRFNQLLEEYSPVIFDNTNSRNKQKRGNMIVLSDDDPTYQSPTKNDANNFLFHGSSTISSNNGSNTLSSQENNSWNINGQYTGIQSNLKIQPENFRQIFHNVSPSSSKHSINQYSSLSSLQPPHQLQFYDSSNGYPMLQQNNLNLNPPHSYPLNDYRYSEQPNVQFNNSSAHTNQMQYNNQKYKSQHNNFNYSSNTYQMTENQNYYRHSSAHTNQMQYESQHNNIAESSHINHMQYNDQQYTILNKCYHDINDINNISPNIFEGDENNIPNKIMVNNKNSKKIKTIPHPNNPSILYKEVDFYDISEVYSMKMLKEYFILKDSTTDFQRWSRACKCNKEFEERIRPLLLTHDHHNYKLRASKPRLFHCLDCFNCMSMIKYRATYHKTEEAAKAYLFSLKTKEEEAEALKTTNQSKKRQKKPLQSQTENTDDQEDSDLQSDTPDTIPEGRFVLITLYHIGEHKSFLHVVNSNLAISIK